MRLCGLGDVIWKIIWNPHLKWLLKSNIICFYFILITHVQLNAMVVFFLPCLMQELMKRGRDPFSLVDVEFWSLSLRANDKTSGEIEVSESTSIYKWVEMLVVPSGFSGIWIRAWPRRYRSSTLTNWTVKPHLLGAGQF